MSLETFKKHIHYSSTGYPSKKDVNRFLSFLILVSSLPRFENDYLILPSIPYKYRRFLFVDLHAKHYYTFENRTDDTLIFKITKPLRNIWIKDDQIIITKKAIRFMTCHLLQELLDYKHIKKLRHIETKFKHFSSTSRKVFKQVTFEFLPLHEIYIKHINISENITILEFSNWLKDKQWLIHKMMKRKLSSDYPKVRYSIKDNQLFIYDTRTINKLRRCL